mgnify:CR=1 FL=1
MGLAGRNHLVTISAAVLLLLKLLGLDPALEYLEKNGVKVGLIFLIVSVMVPFVSGSVSPRNLLQIMGSPAGLTAILGGAFASYLSGRGVAILEVNPEIIVGLIIGSILGTTFLAGVPVGPLVAAGFAAVFLDLARLGR